MQQMQRFYHACEEVSIYRLTKLLDEKIDVNAKISHRPKSDPDSGTTALEHVCFGIITKDTLDFMSLLLENGADPNIKSSHYNALYRACDSSPRGDHEYRIKAIELLLDYGADVNIETPNGITPLMTVCTSVYIDNNIFSIIKLLVERGADKNLTSKYGYNALHYLCEIGENTGFKYRHKAIELLVENINTKTETGDTPLHIAYNSGYLELILFLINLGADPDITNREGVYPIFYLFVKYLFFWNNHRERRKSQEYFMNMYSKRILSLTDSSGNTLLHRVAREKVFGERDSTIELLTSYGADLFRRNKEGILPYDLVLQHGNMKSLKICCSQLREQTLNEEDKVIDMTLSSILDTQDMVTITFANREIKMPLHLAKKSKLLKNLISYGEDAIHVPNYMSDEDLKILVTHLHYPNKINETYILGYFDINQD